MEIKNKLTAEQLAMVHEQANREVRINDWRMGQAYFNALYALYPDTANEIRGTDLDPFYHSERIIKCDKAIRLEE